MSIAALACFAKLRELPEPQIISVVILTGFPISYRPDTCPNNSFTKLELRRVNNTFFQAEMIPYNTILIGLPIGSNGSYDMMNEVTPLSSLQEIFDYTTRKIIEQGGPSVDAERHCLYREKRNGRKCAMGWLIPDSKYQKKFEGLNAVEVIGQIGDLKYDKSRIAFIRELQMAHDRATVNSEMDNFFFSWKQNLNSLGNNHGLDISVLEEIPLDTP